MSDQYETLPPFTILPDNLSTSSMIRIADTIRALHHKYHLLEEAMKHPQPREPQIHPLASEFKLPNISREQFKAEEHASNLMRHRNAMDCSSPQL